MSDVDIRLLGAAKKMTLLLNDIRCRELSQWSNRAMEVLLETKPVIEEAESRIFAQTKEYPKESSPREGGGK